MPAIKRDDNKIVAFVRKRQDKGLDTRPGEVIAFIQNTFGIATYAAACTIIGNLRKRGKLFKEDGLIYVSRGSMKCGV
jgi:hypothetical protein